MTVKPAVAALAAIAAIAGAASYGFYRLGIDQGQRMNRLQSAGAPATGAPARTPDERDTAPSSGNKVLYWHDPMVPGQKFDKPGKSPFMDMPLVPVYADAPAEAGSVSINAQVQQNLGVRTADVRQGTLSATVEAVGSVAYNERDLAVVQARAEGFLERLHVRAPLDRVRKGQPLAEIYVPSWVAAQEEYLTATRIGARFGSTHSGDLIDGALQRMRLAGMSDEQIRAFETGAKIQTRATITAPIGGVVGELTAREGMTVTVGTPLFRLNGLSTVWVNADIPEGVAMEVRPGTTVRARAVAWPGVVLEGNVSALLPEVNQATRTVKARIELANPGERLVPGMFVTVIFGRTDGKPVLLVPSEAVIQTGKRTVVVVARADGRFAPTDVEAGLESNGQTEIRNGLQAGQKVVVSGQFLFDSEASLKASITRMTQMPASATPAAPAEFHRGQGNVESIGTDEITISHGPIASLHWGAMTMAFKSPAAGVPSGISPGTPVIFEFAARGDGTFEIRSMAPAPQPVSSDNRAKTSAATADPAARPPAKR
jgi:Cu(I)/Ag(I) efflux system membrane fusion protein